MLQSNFSNGGEGEGGSMWWRFCDWFEGLLRKATKGEFGEEYVPVREF